MSKAALNMLTETEAQTAWHGRRVAMDMVVPGYMSAAPEYEDAFDGVRPIGWEDIVAVCGGGNWGEGRLETALEALRGLGG
ncbi:hypothetical protein BKA58DRAFT_383357 [Alternaria rosae]|uniref:uncharacterized protein n=1 Tax=Alternaria rosae TaxID=1187941 RepID=UPI001E8DD415|nr:uncharacterized protein BKA58DRAFT_383357 [Alternaria rosae]KAH6873052.1 hypothetical protein BKA58DRAFT_383357 [Alternaria rosae]